VKFSTSAAASYSARSILPSRGDPSGVRWRAIQPGTAGHRHGDGFPGGDGI